MIALLISAKETPKVLAFSRSITISTWAASGMPSTRMPVENRALARHLHQLAGCFRKGHLALAAAVLQAEGEAAGGAEAFDRRRREREGGGVLEREELAVHAVGDFLHGIAGAAVCPVLQGDEGERGIGAVAREGEALDRHDILRRRIRSGRSFPPA